MRDIDDSDLENLDRFEDDEPEEAEEDSDINVEVPAVKPDVRKKASTRSGPVLKAFRDTASFSTHTPASKRRSAQVTDFMSSMTAALDPAARDARDDTRFARRLAQDEVHRLAQDNRDLRARNDGLQDRLHQQQLELSRLQSRLEMFEVIRAMHPAQSSYPRPDGYYSHNQPSSTRTAPSPSYTSTWHSPLRTPPRWSVPPQEHPASPIHHHSYSPPPRPAASVTLTLTPSRRRHYTSHSSAEDDTEGFPDHYPQ